MSYETDKPKLELVSDTEQPIPDITIIDEEDDQYDHDYDPNCEECGEEESDCECEDGFTDSGECAICGFSEDDPIHQDDN